MNIFSTQPIEEIEITDFRNSISNKVMVASHHAYDHLSEAQRKVFKVEELISMLTRQNPRKVYLQKNGRYRAYYRKSDGYRELIIGITEQQVIIVSFMDPPEIPKFKIENG